LFPNPARGIGDSFGYSVAGNKKQVLIGAPQADRFSESEGRAYLIDQRTAAVEAVFPNPAPSLNDRFGHAVATFGKAGALVGAPNEDASATNAGAVYVFTTAVPKDNAKP
jgi:hypothetical protein